MLVLVLLVAVLPFASPASAAGGTAPGAPTFVDDIAPILYRSCTPCHRPGQPGPFSLISYEDARRRARLLAQVTTERLMPPWQPDPGHGEFAGERRLTPSDIALFDRWAASGAPQGDATHTPPPPMFAGGWTLGKPDAIVRLPRPYVLESSGPDQVRTFVVSTGIRQRRFIRAIAFDPGTTQAIHHANIKIDTLRSSRWLDQDDPAEGYEGAGGRGARFPDGHFLGWTPGQSARVTDETPWRLDAGADLVLELHLTPTGKRERISPAVALYFTDEPSQLSPYMIRIGRQDLDIPAGEPAHRVRDEYQLPVDVQVLAVQPHAHNLARSLRVWAIEPDGREEPLLSISRWNARWQDVYRYERPVLLSRGATVVAEYLFDNSARNPRNPHNPPSRVTFGQSADAEMGDVWLQVLTADARARDTLDAHYMPKMLHEDISGARMVLRANPADPRAYTDLALCYVAAGEHEKALGAFAQAVRLKPDSAGARLDLGVALLRSRKLDEARAELDEAIRLDPDLPEAWGNRGAVSHLQRNLPEALRFYARALELDPDNAEVHYNTGRVHADAGALTAAIAHYERALAAAPDDIPTLTSLASALARSNQSARAVDTYRQVLRLNPDFAPALVDLAWLLATAEPAHREPAEAVRLAERADRVTTPESATVLDTLAVAYASDGRTAEAIRTASRALEIALASGADALAERITLRVEAYRAMDGSPVR